MARSVFPIAVVLVVLLVGVVALASFLQVPDFQPLAERNTGGYAAVAVPHTNYAGQKDYFFDETIFNLTTIITDTAAKKFRVDVSVKKPVSNNFFVSKKGYYSTGSTWTEFTLQPVTGSSYEGEWIRGSAQASLLGFDGNDFTTGDPGYVIVYTCREYAWSDIDEISSLGSAEKSILRNAFPKEYRYFCGFQGFSGTTYLHHRWRAVGFETPFCIDVRTDGVVCGTSKECGTVKDNCDVARSCGTCASDEYCEANSCEDLPDLTTEAIYWNNITNRITVEFCSDTTFVNTSTMKYYFEGYSNTTISDADRCGERNWNMPADVAAELMDGKCDNVSLTSYHTRLVNNCGFGTLGKEIRVGFKIDPLDTVSETSETNNELTKLITSSFI